MRYKMYQSKQRKFAAIKPVKQYLAFMLGEDEYAIDILKIQKIKTYNSLTIETISKVPDYFIGFINLNEIITPIIDLRVLYGAGKIEYNDLTVVIMLKAIEQIIGIIVTNVTEIISLPEDQIKPALFYESIIHYTNIQGIGVMDDKLITILDPDKLFLNENIDISRYNHRSINNE